LKPAPTRVAGNLLLASVATENIRQNISRKWCPTQCSKVKSVELTACKLKNIPVSLLGTRFTNAMSCFKPGPHEPYRDIFIETEGAAADLYSTLF
jgi:hypothetical protein